MRFTDSAATPLGAPGRDLAPSIATISDLTRIMGANQALGVMQSQVRATSDYLKSRKQFGVTLNTFQTLTQRAADMYVSLELARSMNLYAAMSISDGVLDPVISARAKLQIARSGRHISQEAIQLHGGIGVTAEYPIAHYAARLTAINHTLGSAEDQLKVLSGQVGEYEIATL